LLLRLAERINGHKINTATVNQGYRYKQKIGNTQIQIPAPFNNKKTKQIQAIKTQKGLLQSG
ncbi:MAG: hypothetical protein ACE5DN_01635, partial [Flavobacteriales bacterium]